MWNDGHCINFRTVQMCVYYLIAITVIWISLWCYGTFSYYDCHGRRHGNPPCGFILQFIYYIHESSDLVIGVVFASSGYMHPRIIGPQQCPQNWKVLQTTICFTPNKFRLLQNEIYSVEEVLAKKWNICMFNIVCFL